MPTEKTELTEERLAEIARGDGVWRAEVDALCAMARRCLAAERELAAIRAHMLRFSDQEDEGQSTAAVLAAVELEANCEHERAEQAERELAELRREVAEQTVRNMRALAETESARPYYIGGGEDAGIHWHAALREIVYQANALLGPTPPATPEERCQECDGSGRAERWNVTGPCKSCNGTGQKSPPPDEPTFALCDRVSGIPYGKEPADEMARVRGTLYSLAGEPGTAVILDGTRGHRVHRSTLRREPPDETTMPAGSPSRDAVTSQGESGRHPHLIDGEFQSDKYPTCPRGKVPLSCKDPTAQDLLWEYAQRRRAVDAEFADDLEEALRLKGYVHAEPEQQATARAALEKLRAWRANYTVLHTGRFLDELESHLAKLAGDGT